MSDDDIMVAVTLDEFETQVPGGDVASDNDSESTHSSTSQKHNNNNNNSDDENEQISTVFELSVVEMMPEWTLSVEEKKIGAFETFLLCVSNSLANTTDSDMQGSLRELQGAVQSGMMFSRADTMAYTRWLSPIPDAVAEGMFEGVKPYLHFRFLLITTHRPHHFGHPCLFKSWVLRQLKLFLCGLVCIVRRSQLDPWFVFKTQFSARELEFLLIGTFKDFFLHHVAPIGNVEFEERRYTNALARLQTTVWSMYDFLAEKNIHPEALQHGLRYPYPMNVALYEEILVSAFQIDDDDDSRRIPRSPYAMQRFETLVLECFKPLAISNILHEFSMIRVAFQLYMRSPAPKLMDFVTNRIQRLPELKVDQNSKIAFTRIDMSTGNSTEVNLKHSEVEYLEGFFRMLEFFHRRLCDMRIHFGLDEELLRPEVTAWATLREKLKPIASSKFYTSYSNLIHPEDGLKIESSPNTIQWTPVCLEMISELQSLLNQYEQSDVARQDDICVRMNNQLNALTQQTGGDTGEFWNRLKSFFDLSRPPKLLPWREIIPAILAFSEEERTKQSLDETSRILYQYVLSSGRKHYHRVVTDVCKGKSPELIHMAQLTNRMLHEISLEKRITREAFGALGTSNTNLEIVGLREIARLFGVAVKQTIEQRMDQRQKAQNIKVAAGMYPHLQELKRLLQLGKYHVILGSDDLFASFVDAWMLRRGDDFLSFEERVEEREDYISMREPDLLHSRYVHRLFEMFLENVKFFMEMTIPHNTDEMESLARNVNFTVQKYASSVRKLLWTSKIPARFFEDVPLKAHEAQNLNVPQAAPVATASSHGSGLGFRSLTKVFTTPPAPQQQQHQQQHHHATATTPGSKDSKMVDVFASSMKYFSSKTKEAVDAVSGAVGEVVVSFTTAEAQPEKSQQKQRKTAGAPKPKDIDQMFVLLFNVVYAIEQLEVLDKYVKKYQRKINSSVHQQEANDYFSSSASALVLAKKTILANIAEDCVWHELLQPIGTTPMYDFLYTMPTEDNGIKLLLQPIDVKLGKLCSLALKKNLSLRDDIARAVFRSVVDAVVKVSIHPGGYPRMFYCVWATTTLKQIQQEVQMDEFWSPPFTFAFKSKNKDAARVLEYLQWVAEDLFHFENFIVGRRPNELPEGLSPKEAKEIIQPLQELFQHLLFGETPYLVNTFFDDIKYDQIGVEPEHWRIGTSKNTHRILFHRFECSSKPGCDDPFVGQFFDLISSDHTPSQQLVELFEYGKAVPPTAFNPMAPKNVAWLLRSKRDDVALDFQRLRSKATKDLIAAHKDAPEDHVQPVKKDVEPHTDKSAHAPAAPATKFVVGTKKVIEQLLLFYKADDPVAIEFLKSLN